jgi:hypothetical protein
MRSRRWLTRGSLLALALVGACKDSPTDETDLTPSTGALSMDYCAADAPAWFGIKTEGGTWQMVTPDASNSFHFDASSKFIMAVARQNSRGTALSVTFTTAAEFAAISGVACDEPNGPRTFSGSVVGLGSTENASISLGSHGNVLRGEGNYSIASVPDRPMDLLAIRSLRQSDNDTPDRIIIRRSISPSAQSPLPRLDFTTSEAVAPASNPATITGLLSTDEGSLIGGITTATGTLGSVFILAPTTGAGTVYSLPAAQLIANDLQFVIATAFDQSRFDRGMVKYYRTPVPQALIVGPRVNLPTFSSSQSAGFTLLRAQLAAQAEYASAVTFEFFQAARYLSLTATSAYFGGSPATWDLSTPDVHTAPGFQRSWAIESNLAQWFVTAYGMNRPVVVLGAEPVDGETVRYSTRGSFGQVSLRPRLPDRVR